MKIQLLLLKLDSGFRSNCSKPANGSLTYSQTALFLLENITSGTIPSLKRKP